MEKVFAFLVAVLLTASVFAQSPEKMSYQAVIRNSSDILVANTQIGMEINIRQGSPAGTVVYTETQTPTTNANGLVSIEIGGGAGFSTINWDTSTYFIETKTAVDVPLTTYTITGTSQLLSVPYALHAKTAESITGTITETDPVYGVSVASGITGTDTTNWNNKQDQLIAGTNISIVGNTISATGGSTLAIGDSYQGGIIFWLDETGQHGLIAATTDQSTGMRWYAGTNTNTMAFANGIGAGIANTSIIIANQGYGDGATYAARICNEYSVTIGGVTYGDWYLPSKYELNLLYQQKTVVGGFSNDTYWSSSEYVNGAAFAQVFLDGYIDWAGKNSLFYVRAVRRF